VNQKTMRIALTSHDRLGLGHPRREAGITLLSAARGMLDG
jgi:hypothetical protein